METVMMTSGIESKYFLPFQAGPGETPQTLCTVQASSGSSGAARLCGQALASVQAKPTTCFLSLLEYSKKGESHMHDINVSEP
jgi:hypothetical protein